MRILLYILSAVTFVLALYGIIAQSFKYNNLMMLFLSVTMLVMGVIEFKAGRKVYGWLSLVVFLFGLYVTIQGFYYNGLFMNLN